MSNNIVRLAVKKNMSHYNLLEYKESLGEIF